MKVEERKFVEAQRLKEARAYLPILGMVIPPLIGNPYNGHINHWVDDHPLLYGNNGSLDPGTYKTSLSLDIQMTPAEFGIWTPKIYRSNTEPEEVFAWMSRVWEACFFFHICLLLH